MGNRALTDTPCSLVLGLLRRPSSASQTPTAFGQNQKPIAYACCQIKNRSHRPSARIKNRMMPMVGTLRPELMPSIETLLPKAMTGVGTLLPLLMPDVGTLLPKA
jgi:hypothetical protein